MKNGLRVLCHALLIVSAAVGRAQTTPAPTFTVTDIKVEGLQRITEGTVFNQLPIDIGDTLTPPCAT